MNALDQAFYDAAGFSGQALSLGIRTLIFFLAVLWGAFIIQGLLSELHTSPDPAYVFVKLVLVCVLLVALWIIVY